LQTQWLEWAQRLQALSQTGLAFAGNPFKVERYESSVSLTTIAIQNGRQTLIEEQSNGSWTLTSNRTLKTQLATRTEIDNARRVFT
jgi:hypothetical protein